VSIALQRAQAVSILKQVVIAIEGSPIQVSHPFLFYICFLQLVGILEHDLFQCTFVMHFGFCFCVLNLSSFVVPFFPLIGCFV
jgi:hypothetical protein